MYTPTSSADQSITSASTATVTSYELAPYIVHHACEDIEQFARSGQLDLDIKQLSPGTFGGRTSLIRLPGCTLTRRYTTAAHICTCWVPQAVSLLFPLVTQDVFLRGRQRGPRHQIGSLGNLEIFSVIPQNYAHIMVTLPLESLGRHLSPQECCLLIETAATIENGVIDEGLKAATTARLLHIFGAIEEAPVLDDGALRGYSEQVAQLVFGYLAAHSGREPTRSSNHEKVLQRALNLIAARPNELLSLDDLARDVFASKRAVQYAFGTLLGVSPMRFQKLYRLNLVRSELRVARSPLKFAGIVSKYAFTNQGRMAREYTDLFGERPSDTLRLALKAMEPASAPAAGRACEE